MTYDNDGPIYSVLTGKNNCTIGNCTSEWTWLSFNEQQFEWFGGYGCNCWKADNPEPYQGNPDCPYSDAPNYSGTLNEEIAYTPCYG